MRPASHGSSDRQSTSTTSSGGSQHNARRCSHTHATATHPSAPSPAGQLLLAVLPSLVGDCAKDVRAEEGVDLFPPPPAGLWPSLDACTGFCLVLPSDAARLMALPVSLPRPVTTPTAALAAASAPAPRALAVSAAESSTPPAMAAAVPFGPSANTNELRGSSRQSGSSVSAEVSETYNVSAPARIDARVQRL